ncbi:hypothetical protein JHL21_04675 [Devosia sp. WQ 349]|uniref:hypothetical protein n=1 Tax=Devosia sp. WQ 349K1 TaxID=2800329 RepID=UPI0019080B9F|nr:hypothetical protein [Devosia sp. WQ 349K1]MBK1793785.1 hypothetical protein [Devosia sp. WQ 349K1]
MKPWEFHPDLTADRLEVVARLIALARDMVVDRHEPSIGDDDWVLGCRAFRSSCHMITSFSEQEDVNWLSIVDPSKRFVFRLGSIPLRFYRGDPEDQNHRVKNVSFPELRQLSLAFDTPDLLDVTVRIAIETDAEGAALAIFCVGSHADEILFNWNIPFSSPIDLRTAPEHTGAVELGAPPVGEREADEVELGAPPVGEREADEDDNQDNDDHEDGNKSA